MQYLKIYFLFTSAVFRCSSNDIALKGLFLHHCVVFSLFCVAIVISEPFFARAYFRPDFAAIRRKKFAARYFWFKAKLKQKKFIFEQYSVTSTCEIKIGRFYFFSRKSSVVSQAQGLLTILHVFRHSAKQGHPNIGEDIIKKDRRPVGFLNR